MASEEIKSCNWSTSPILHRRRCIEQVFTFSSFSLLTCFSCCSCINRQLICQSFTAKPTESVTWCYPTWKITGSSLLHRLKHFTEFQELCVGKIFFAIKFWLGNRVGLFRHLSGSQGWSFKNISDCENFSLWLKLSFWRQLKLCFYFFVGINW